METNNQAQDKVLALKQAVADRRKALCKDFSIFREHYFKSYHRCPDAEFHTEISSLLQKISEERGARVAIAAPRESAKSTLITLEFLIYCICYKIERFIVIASNTKEQGMNFLSNIKREFLTNSKLRNDFPEVFVGDEKPKRSKLGQEEIITSTGILIMVRGTSQTPRGFKNQEDRPTLIILDDVEGSELSLDGLYKLEDWVMKDLFKSVAPGANIICVGTIHHQASLLAKLTDPNQYHGWYQKIYRSVIVWADNERLWEQWRLIFRRREQYDGADGEESALKFFEANKEEMLKGVQVLWPESKNYYSLMVMIEKEGMDSFSSEMQNNPFDGRSQYFNIDEYHYWSDQYPSIEELLSALRSKSDISIVGACDPSMGKINGDRSAIVSVVKDNITQNMYVIDADICRRKSYKIYEDIISFYRCRQYKQFGFEAIQAQDAMADVLEEQAKNAGVHFKVERIQHNATSKIARIQALQLPLQQGRLLLCRQHVTLLDEMKCFPKGQFDDGLDALAMAVKIAEDCQGGTVGSVEPIYPVSPGYPVIEGLPYHSEALDLSELDTRIRARDDLRYEREGRMD
jgi:predicted phage terminase large subunit-like protein